MLAYIDKCILYSLVHIAIWEELSRGLVHSRSGGSGQRYCAGSDSLEVFGTAANPIVLAAAGDQVCLPFSQHGWCKTGSGKSLDLILSGVVSGAGDDDALLAKRPSDKSNVDELDALFAAED